MRRSITLAAVALLLIAGGCASGVSGPQTYAVQVDSPSPEGKKFQTSAFFPGDVSVVAGDTIEFANASTEAPHTITFGVLADRSNQPQLLTPDGENPAAFGPCRNADDPKADLAKCESQELGAYDGTGFWNSGLLVPAPAPEEAGPKDITVELADDIPTGEYTFVCVLHPFMNGNITVVEDEGDRETPEDITAAAQEASDAAVLAGDDLEEPKLERDGETYVVSAGWGDRIIAVNKFAPAQVDVEAGSTVRWVARSPYEPHTITFESPFEGEDPASFVPGGVKSGSAYTGGFSNSGLLGAEGGPFATSFELSFPKAGEYKYVCALHPGQEGAVKVT